MSSVGRGLRSEGAVEVCPVPVGDVPDAVSDGFVFALPRPRCPGENVETPLFKMWRAPTGPEYRQARRGGEHPTMASWRVSARHVGQLCLGAPIRCRFWLCARFRGLVGGAFGVAEGGSRAGHRFPGAARPAGVVRWLWGCR